MQEFIMYYRKRDGVDLGQQNSNYLILKRWMRGAICKCGLAMAVTFEVRRVLALARYPLLGIGGRLPRKFAIYPRIHQRLHGGRKRPDKTVR